MSLILDFVIYMAIFGLALGFLCLSYSSRKYRRLYIALAVLIPCAFAGIRPYEVGTDVQVYAQRVFAAAQAGYDTLLTRYANIEIGYLLMAYLSAKVFRTLGGMLFLTHLMIVLPVMLAIRRTFAKRQALLAGSVFCFVLYCMTLNVMRQSMAAAWVFLGLCLWMERKRVPGAACIVLAMLFHNTAIVGVAIVLLPQLIAGIRRRSLRWLCMLLLAFSSAFLAANWEKLVGMIIALIPSLQKYTYYVNVFTSSQESYLTTIDIARYFDILWRFAVCVLPLIVGAKALASERRRWFYVVTAGYIMYVACIFMFNSAYGYRIAIYSDFFMMMYYGCSAYGERAKLSRSSHPISVNNALMTLLLVGGFAVEYLLMGWHEVNDIVVKFLAG